ncbi:MAG TPA: DUF222 domain-containing protein [Mycobacterium sp.]|nr:DUF222 domain-containing protein [Mycobacterium sp.]
MTGDDQDDISTAREAVVDARREAAAASARLAEAAVQYADCRTADDTAAGIGSGRRSRVRPGEFVADELALLLREQPYPMRCLLARTRRLASGLPTVWEAFRCGDLDPEQIRIIDRVARRVTEPATLAAIDEHAVEAAQARSPKQLQVWLLRLVVQLEPLAFQQRHRRALAERRVTVVQGADGIGYVTGEMSAADAAAIDAVLAAAARNLGADDPRTDQQRRADLFADLLLGRLAFDHTDTDDEDEEEEDTAGAESDWLEVENIDFDTGELLSTKLQRIDPQGQTIGEPVEAATHRPPGQPPKIIKRPQQQRIGIVVPLASLLDASDTPGELADRSGFIPGDILIEQIAAALNSDSRDEVLFTRLLTDNGGRLLDVTEIGRYPSARLAQAIKIRAGSCRFPTCTVPADRCDLDHHEPVPKGVTSGRNLDPFCRRHHRGKTFAWHAAHRDHDGVDWTMPDAEHYRCIDEPLPTGRASVVRP